MEKKARELLINLLEAGEDLIEVDIDATGSDDMIGRDNTFNAILKVAEAFISEPKALETVKTIIKTREGCDTLYDAIWSGKEEVNEEHEKVLLSNRLKVLKARINL